MIASIISTLKDIGSGIGDIDMTVSVLERYINAKNEKGMRAVDIAYQKIIKQNGLRNLSLILNWSRLRLFQALYTKNVSSLSSSSSSSSSFDPEIGNGSTNNSLLMFSSGNTTTMGRRRRTVSYVNPDFVEKVCETCSIKYKISFYKRNTSAYCSKQCSNANVKVLNKMRESQKKTYFQKYNGMHPMQTDGTKKNFKNAILDKYGVESYSKLDVYKQRVKKDSFQHAHTN
jgi:hypothetical protein